MADYRKRYPEMRPNVRNNPLHKEIALIAHVILDIEVRGKCGGKGYPEGVNRQKNASDSESYRLKGNELFKSQSHTLEIHQKILERYSQSIALAPNRSEELAMAYGNRSALLQHVKKYKECLEDCNRAINITKFDLLKAKLTCRKLECLSALNDELLENEVEVAADLLMKFTLDDEVKQNYMAKIRSINIDTLSTSNSGKDWKRGKKSKKSKNLDPSELFEHQKEIPCASEAVTIKYNKQWGRHIVATRNINPGEIIAVEKHFHKFVYNEHLYLCCTYCTKFSWSSIPCESCIYGVYCSKECRAAAWEEFHKFECKVFPHMWDIDADLVAAPHTGRFFLNLVHKAGGVEKLRQEFLDVQKAEDPRTKGFSHDGIFHSDKSRSILGLQDYSNECSEELEWWSAYYATLFLHFLMKETDFFGERMGNSVALVIPTNRDVEFVGAMFLRLSYLPCTYGSQILINTEDNWDFTGVFLSPFCGLFNHSCDPNVRFIRSKNNETIVYAKHPIREGEQLFRSYFGDYCDTPKEERVEGLTKMYHFTCQCLACENDWTRDNLPSAWDNMKKRLNSDQLIKFGEKLASVGSLDFKNMFRFKGSQTLCKPAYFAEVLEVQREIASKASVHSKEYELFDQYVYMYYLGNYGRWLDVPEIC